MKQCLEAGVSETPIPDTQYAVQLTAPGELRLNRAKPVFRPRPHEILFRVEAVGLCFSDLKLLSQFDAHARKGPVQTGIDEELLAGIQSYVPGLQATVPGHEAVGRIVAVGEKVVRHRVGERCLVQTDYRELRTGNSNAAFGYNFEGGLQEYTLFDERVVIDPDGERFLIPVGEDKSASAIALVEPWACVEDSYANPERRTILAGGELLLVAAPGREIPGVEQAFPEQALPKQGSPGRITRISPSEAGYLPDEVFDDIIYLGCDREVIEILDRKLAPGGIINLVLDGGAIGETVEIGVGRVHYGMTRWIGTTSGDASRSYATIPALGEIRAGERILVVGAGGPMGQMHVIRSLSSKQPDLSLLATDLDSSRLLALEAKVRGMVGSGVEFRTASATEEWPRDRISYFALMAPIPALVSHAVEVAAEGALISIFAGIPASVRHPVDLDAYIEKGCFFLGTSGSVIRDMKTVLRQVESDDLDTNASVDAICGMAGAREGITAVSDRRFPGKIVVYPALHDLDLVALSDLPQRFPTVAECLEKGRWCRAAEEELLSVAR
jgi:L-sorbose 1-phosphate reductase